MFFEEQVRTLPLVARVCPRNKFEAGARPRLRLPPSSFLLSKERPTHVRAETDVLPLLAVIATSYAGVAFLTSLVCLSGRKS